MLGLWTLNYLNKNPNTRAKLIVAITSVIGILVILGNSKQISKQYEAIYTNTGKLLGEVVFYQRADTLGFLFFDYVILGAMTLPLSPIVGGAMGAFEKVRKKLRLYRTAEEMAQDYEAHEQKRLRRLEQMAREAAAVPPPHAQQGELLLGTVLSGDTLPRGVDSVGALQRGKGLHLNEWLLNEHLFALGATGSGKSTALKRLCAEILAHTERDLFVIDGKGEDEFADELREMVWTYRGIEPPVVRLGGLKGGDAYNAFCGTKQAVYNRLAAMVGTQEAEGNGIYHADVNRNILQLVCYAPQGVPRNFTQLRERLSLEWLIAMYEGRPDAVEVAQIKPVEMAGLAARLLPLIREFDEVVNDRGFTLHETRCAIFSIKALSIGDTAKRFCRFLIEDIKDFVANRATRPGVVLFDEFGVFGSENIRDVLAQARSKQWGVGLATQDYANLGDEQTARQIIANTGSLLLMGTNFPEELAMLAGTKMQLESSIQSDETGPTGMSSGRLQHAIKVDINRARRFQRGQAYFIRKGYTVAVQVSDVKLSPEQREAVPSPEAPVVEPQVTQLELPTDEVQPETRETKGRKRGRARL